ncbi:MAG TPA: hypothetical protein VIK89_03665 [Cytophagaceae bacterium]|jgi:hypothetical protein
MLLRMLFFSCLMFGFFTSSCQKKSEDCIYIIPRDFEGNILIIFNQKDGMDISYEDGKRVYKIDSTGVLKTQFVENYGVHQNFFYVVEENNKRIPLRYLLPAHKENIPKSSAEIFIYNMETGKDYDAKVSKDRYIELFTVSTIKNLDSIGNLKSSFMWKQLNAR